MRIIEKKIRTSDAFELFYRKVQPKVSKCAVIFLHGIALHSGIYAEAIKRLGEYGMFVLAPDQRGRGRSTSLDWKKGDLHSVDRMSQDIAELRQAHMAEIGKLPTYVIGASLGGIIGLYHAQSNNHINGVAIGGPPFGAYSPLSLAVTSLIARIDPKHEMNEGYLEKIAGTPERAKEFRSDSLVNDKGLKAESALELLRAIKQIEKAMKKIHVPTLIVYGNRDKLVTMQQIRVMEKKIGSKYCEIQTVDGMGHNLFGEKEYQACFDIVIEWMKRNNPKVLN